MFLSRDWLRRVNYFTGRINNRPYLVEQNMSQLAPKNILRMLRYIGQNGISGHSQKAFNVLRKHDLKAFPAP